MKILKELRKEILNECQYIDFKPFSHNIIGLILKQISKNYGNEEANKAIEDFQLKDLGFNKE